MPDSATPKVTVSGDEMSLFMRTVSVRLIIRLIPAVKKQQIHRKQHTADRYAAIGNIEYPLPCRNRIKVNKVNDISEKKPVYHVSDTAAEQKPEPKTAAEIIAARWAEVDGLTATIKGATTAAPVVWLAGDTKPHEKEIEAAGGKWSGKKNAYYFRVA